jgi:hypothetical protein
MINFQIEKLTEYSARVSLGEALPGLAEKSGKNIYGVGGGVPFTASCVKQASGIGRACS